MFDRRQRNPASRATTENTMAIDLSKLSQDQLIALIGQMQSAPARHITLKVSTKGAMSLYGLGRWPVTLYKSQWQALLGHTTAIEAFIADNAALLADKPQA